MPFPYQADYARLLDDERPTLDCVSACTLDFDGEFTAQQIIDAVCKMKGIADCWLVLNALDHLVTLAQIRELTNPDEVWGQHRRFVRN